MIVTAATKLTLPLPNRRVALRAGALGFGLTSAKLSALAASSGEAVAPRAKSVLFIFLTGGLSHHDSFDMKPAAPAEIRGEFKPISTRTPGLQICEHLPRLAERSETPQLFARAVEALVRLIHSTPLTISSASPV